MSSNSCGGEGSGHCVFVGFHYSSHFVSLISATTPPTIYMSQSVKGKVRLGCYIDDLTPLTLTLLSFLIVGHYGFCGHFYVSQGEREKGGEREREGWAVRVSTKGKGLVQNHPAFS